MNISRAEQIASALAGASLTFLAFRRHRLARALLSSTGSALLARGLTGFCPAYAAVGRNTRRRDGMKRFETVAETRL